MLTYKIGGLDFKDFGVLVSGSEGLIDRPKVKAPVSFSWDNEHGSVVDLAGKFYEAREITLNCFVAADSRLTFVERVLAFERVLDKPGSLRLEVYVDPTKPLLYEVYCEDLMEVKKTWSEGKMVGTFSLKLKEAEPVKRVYRFTRTQAVGSCKLSIDSTKLFNVYWGDGSVDYDVRTNAVTHAYGELGDYYVLVAGDVDSIRAVTINNATLVWNKL